MSVPLEFREHLLVEIDGEHVGPTTIDSRVALALASAYVDLLMKVADEEGLEFSLTGLQIIDKCAAVAMKSSNYLLARSAAQDVAAMLHDPTNAPAGFGAYVERVDHALKELPEGQQAKVSVGDWQAPLKRYNERRKVPSESTTSLRVEVLKAGGAKPAARFNSASEDKPFTLSVSKEWAILLGKYLYGEVQITARIRRDEDGNIESGNVQEVAPVESDDPETAWREWFENQRAAWREVGDDIETELGRHDH